MTAIILTAPEAKTAAQTVRVLVEISSADDFQGFLLDLVLPLDATPCRPKIDAYVAAEFPGYRVDGWWTPCDPDGYADEF